MIRAVIIDDEPRSRETLSALLERHCIDVSIVGEAHNVNSALTVVRSTAPDILFLDISMPDGNGFDLLDQVENPSFETIFVTAHNEYAIKAIKAKALDYLLKPVDISELQAAVENARKRIDEKQSTIQNDRKRLSITLGSIAIPISTGLQFIKTDDIIHITASGNYTRFFCTDGSSLVSSSTLGEYKNILPEQQFFRIHHSEVINLQHIKQYQKGVGRDYVIMCNDAAIGISRRRKKQFLELFSYFSPKNR